MRRQFVNKIACVNSSLAIIRFRARATNPPENTTVESQPSGNIAIGQYAIIDLGNVGGAKRNETEFQIFVEQEPLDIAGPTSTATVTYSPPNRPTANFVATYLVTGTAGLLQVALLE
jgi:hypothetical protein